MRIMCLYYLPAIDESGKSLNLNDLYNLYNLLIYIFDTENRL